MIIALPIWKNRISPVFDVARQVLVLQVEDGKETARHVETLPETPGSRLAILQHLNVQALVCGAISQPLADLAESAGIEVMPFVAGDVEEVVEACCTGAIENPSFAMPGCRGANSRFAQACANRQGRRRCNMPRGDGTGPQGQGPAGQGRGRGRGLCNPGQGGGKGGGRRSGSGQGGGRQKDPSRGGSK